MVRPNRRLWVDLVKSVLFITESGPARALSAKNVGRPGARAPGTAGFQPAPLSKGALPAQKATQCRRDACTTTSSRLPRPRRDPNSDSPKGASSQSACCASFAPHRDIVTFIKPVPCRLSAYPIKTCEESHCWKAASARARWLIEFFTSAGNTPNESS